MREDEIISDNEYKTISDSIQSKHNIRRKANLNIDETNTCLISHVLCWIDAQISEGIYPPIPVILEVAAEYKEELSLSRNAFGLNTYKEIMSRELKLTDKFRKKSKKPPMEVE